MKKLKKLKKIKYKSTIIPIVILSMFVFSNLISISGLGFNDEIANFEELGENYTSIIPLNFFLLKE